MLYYFCADYPLIIRANGKIIGKLNKNTIHLNLEEKTLIETSPLKAFFLPLNFIIEKNFIKTFQQGIIKADLKEAYYVKFTGIKIPENKFRLISQKKSENTLATAFYDNGFKISFEKNSDLFIDNVDDFTECVINFHTINNSKLVFVELTGEKKIINIYCLDDKIEKIFSDEYYNIEITNNIIITKKYMDIGKHQLKVTYSFENKELKVINYETTLKENFSINDLPFAVLTTFFFEALLYGQDIKELCTESFFSKKDILKEYLGEYIGVFPPPEFKKINEVGLIYKINDGVYYAEYCSLNFEGRLVSNIIKN